MCIGAHAASIAKSPNRKANEPRRITNSPSQMEPFTITVVVPTGFCVRSVVAIKSRLTKAKKIAPNATRCCQKKLLAPQSEYTG